MWRVGFFVHSLCLGEGCILSVPDLAGVAARGAVFIESATGVNVGNCAQISREISRKLDADPAGGDYVLEVSSPGMNRPIWSMEHFKRFTGEAVRFETKRPRNGEMRYSGTIEGVSGDVVQLRIRGGELLELAVDEIESARLDIDPWQGRR